MINFDNRCLTLIFDNLLAPKIIPSKVDSDAKKSIIVLFLCRRTTGHGEEIVLSEFSRISKEVRSQKSEDQPPVQSAPETISGSGDDPKSPESAEQVSDRAKSPVIEQDPVCVDPESRVDVPASLDKETHRVPEPEASVKNQSRVEGIGRPEGVPNEADPNSRESVDSSEKQSSSSSAPRMNHVRPQTKRSSGMKWFLCHVGKSLYHLPLCSGCCVAELSLHRDVPGSIPA